MILSNIKYKKIVYKNFLMALQFTAYSLEIATLWMPHFSKSFIKNVFTNGSIEVSFDGMILKIANL